MIPRSRTMGTRLLRLGLRMLGYCAFRSFSTCLVNRETSLLKSRTSFSSSPICWREAGSASARRCRGRTKPAAARTSHLRFSRPSSGRHRRGLDARATAGTSTTTGPERPERFLITKRVNLATCFDRSRNVVRFRKPFRAEHRGLDTFAGGKMIDHVPQGPRWSKMDFDLLIVVGFENKMDTPHAATRRARICASG